MNLGPILMLPGRLWEKNMADGINLGKAYVQIMPSAEGIQGKLASIIDGEADSAGKSGGAKFSSAFGGVIKTGLGIAAGAAAAGAAAVGSFAKEAIAGYASYEQLIGGVEKLYGSAAETVSKFADQAYKTSGLSANAYMETATSFSAALINSLGGDTAKAAELTDVAMRAMSDNVNVFGSDFASVQNAFQGFAKQNYTMLDNLKLGYGGTKSEMERLIADANTYRASIGETADLSIDSFADVVQAIQSVQEAQNIAGTTNKEAMSTIEGSAAATKAAWENVITAIGRGEGLEEAIDSLISSIFGEGGGGGLLDNILPRIQTTMEGIGQFISTAAPIIADKLPALIEGVLPTLLESGVTLITAVSEGLIQALPMLVPIAFDAISEITNALIENLPLIIECGLEVILSLANGIIEALPDLIPTIVDVVITIVEALIDNVDKLIDAAIAITIALAEGLIKSLPKLIEKAPEIVQKLLNALKENAPKLILAAVELIVKLAGGLIENLPKIVEAAVKIVGELVSGLVQNGFKMVETAGELIGKFKDGILGFVDQAWSWGSDLVHGLADGIRGAIDSVIDAVTDVADAIKERLHFSVPDTGPLADFASYAPDMMKLFAQGIDQNVGIVTNSVDNMGDRLASALNDDLSGTMVDVTANVSGGRRGGAGSVSMGGVTIQVYGAPGQDESVIAQKVSEILNRQVVNARAVFA